MGAAMKKAVQLKISTFFSDYQLVKYEKGHILLRPNEVVQGIYFLQAGRIKQYDISNKGDEVIVNDIGSGEYFPEHAVLNRSLNRYFYETISNCEINIAPIENVIKFIKNNVDVAYEILTARSMECSIIRRRMAHLMGGSSYSRTMFELIIACEKFGELSINGSYVLSLHEEGIARRSGLTRETVNRELQKLKQKRLISVDHHTIIIHNPSALRQELNDRL